MKIATFNVNGVNGRLLGPAALARRGRAGRPSTARYYGIGSLDEAGAYLEHPVLGPWLVLSIETVLGIEGSTLHAIFGSPDDLKFCSSMTLFSKQPVRPRASSGKLSTVIASVARTDGHSPCLTLERKGFWPAASRAQ